MIACVHARVIYATLHQLDHDAASNHGRGPTAGLSRVAVVTRGRDVAVDT
jgi:hypothetical protein